MAEEADSVTVAATAAVAARDVSSSRQAGRPRLGGNGRRQLTHTRDSYSNQFKIDVVNHINDVHDVQATTSLFFRTRSTTSRESTRKLIYVWVRQHDELISRCGRPLTASKKSSRSAGTATTLTREAEMRNVNWINMLRGEGVPVSSKMLQLKGVDVTKEHGITPFHGSWSWRQLFMSRHRLSVRARTRQGQITPQDAEQRAIAFGEEVAQMMAKLNIKKLYIFEYLPTHTVHAKGEKTVWVSCAGNEKKRVTAMLLGDSSGVAYSPFLVMKIPPASIPSRESKNQQERHGFGPIVWREVVAIQRAYNIHIYGNKAAWWNASLSQLFLKHFFGKRIDMQITRSPSSVCQSADVAWNRPFKSLLRDQRTQDLAEQMQAHKAKEKQQQEAKMLFKLVGAGREKIVQWVMDSWSRLTSLTIQNGFVKTHIKPQPEEAISEGLLVDLLSMHLVDANDRVEQDISDHDEESADQA